MPTLLPSLRAVKILHTAVWALFAGCIVAVPIVTWRGDLRTAAILIALVTVEVVVLALNRLRCPLTDVAARFTDDRCPNFDIYLPLWLARFNKQIFGPLFLAGVLFAIARWQGWLE